MKMLKKKLNSNTLWDEFERHYLIEENEINRKFFDPRRIDENVVSKNYSSFPHAIEMWEDLERYIIDYVNKNKPEEYGTYGYAYMFTIPKNFTQYSFWDGLTLSLKLYIKGTGKTKVNLRSFYNPLKSDEDIKYILEHGKFKDLKVQINDYINEDNPITDRMFLDFMHEMLHAYEDLMRITKKNKDILDYQETVNYSDYMNKMVGNNIEDSSLINRFCLLFHFFTKTEIRALISELSGEIQKKSEDELDQFEIKNFITNTETWKLIEYHEGTIDLIKDSENINTRKVLVNKFNEHSVRAKVRNFNELVKFLEDKMFHVKQYIFKKVSKIIANRQQAILEKCVF